MKRSQIRLVACFVFAALMASCTQQTFDPGSPIPGANAIVTVGDLLFITSTDSNELKVLNLIPPAARQNQVLQKLEFLRAPNVLQPLAIPVVDRPTGIARDVHYDAAGKVVEGPYVYAISEGSRQISVVGTVSSDPSAALKWVEVRKLLEATPVTAIAARGGMTATDPSTLYIATYNGERSEVRKVTINRVETLPAALSSNSVQGGVFPGGAIVALLPLPASNKLVVSTRSSGGRAGGTFELDTVTGLSRPYNFPAPVRMLATNPATADGATPAGAFVYGVLDEASCIDRVQTSNHPAAVDPPCRGIMTVDTATGNIANQRVAEANPDGSGTVVVRDLGVPMRPIFFGNSTITGLTVNSDVVANAPNGTGAVRYPMLGMFTVATGQIILFNAQYQHVFDSQFTASAAITGATFRKADGTAAATLPAGGMVFATDPATGAITDPTAAKGAAVNESVIVTFQGVVPGFSNVPVTITTANAIPVAPGALLGRLRLDDHVVATSADKTCSAEVTVTAIAPTQLTTAEMLPAACLGRPVSYTVLAAGGAAPTDTTHASWVVEGTVSGYFGRANNGAQFVPETTRYFTFPPGFNSAAPPPQIQFKLGPGDATVARGDRYELAESAGFTPYFFTFSLSGTSFAQGIAVPTAITYREGVYDSGQRVPDAEVGTRGSQRFRAFIAYPASNGIMEVDLPGIIPTAANTQNFMTYP